MGAVSGTACPHYRALTYMYRLPEASLFIHWQTLSNLCAAGVARSQHSDPGNWTVAVLRIIQTDPGAHPTSYTMGTVSFCG